MKIRGMATLLVAALTATAALAQPVACKLNWRSGQTLTYRVQQQRQASEVLNTARTESTSKLDLVKRWTVQQVDPSGVATVQLSIVSMRLEQAVSNEEPLVYDSAAPEKSDADLKKSLGQYIGVPLALLRVDATGKVVEVKESKFGAASRFEMELPFGCQLPATGVQSNQRWERNFSITLEPPAGSGEKFAAVNKYLCKSVTGGKAVVELVTDIPAWPKNAAEQIPLLERLTQGEVVYDLASGRMESCKLNVSREIKEHQGANSSYKFVSTYVEQLQP